MNILITAPQGDTISRYFPERVLAQLWQMGQVVMNPHSRNFTREELKDALADVDIVITHWGVPQLTAEVLDCAPKLKLLAHATGTVAHIASEAFYQRGIPVLSANSIMADYVAEAVLGYMIAASRRMPALDEITRADQWQDKPAAMKKQKTLLGGHIGLIGLGTIARKLLDMLAPFGCQVHVYDPYAKPNALERWPFAALCSFETAMAQPIVSVHAAQTPETYHMINADALARMPDDGILINSARGSLVDTNALIAELNKGRLYAVLDVYEQEGSGNVPPALLKQKNCILQPHMAAAPVSWEMAQGIVDDIRRFLHHKPLQLQVSLAQYRLMTQE